MSSRALKTPGKYSDVTLERGLSFNSDFVKWTVETRPAPP